MLSAMCFCVLWFPCMLCFIICNSETNGISLSSYKLSMGPFWTKLEYFKCCLNVVEASQHINLGRFDPHRAVGFLYYYYIWVTSVNVKGK